MKTNKSESARPRRWAVVAWPKYHGGGYQLLAGRYETYEGAELASDAAARIHGRTMQVVEVAGPDEQSGAQDKSRDKQFASSDWLGEAEAALVLAEKALNNAGLEGEWDTLPKLERAVSGLREGIEARRRPSPSVRMSDVGRAPNE